MTRSGMVEGAQQAPSDRYSPPTSIRSRATR
jgi:hypothetical protein